MLSEELHDIPGLNSPDSKKEDGTDVLELVFDAKHQQIRADIAPTTAEMIYELLTTQIYQDQEVQDWLLTLLANHGPKTTTSFESSVDRHNSASVKQCYAYRRRRGFACHTVCGHRFPFPYVYHKRSASFVRQKFPARYLYFRGNTSSHNLRNTAYRHSFHRYIRRPHSIAYLLFHRHRPEYESSAQGFGNAS